MVRAVLLAIFAVATTVLNADAARLAAPAATGVLEPSSAGDAGKSPADATETAGEKSDAKDGASSKDADRKDDAAAKDDVKKDGDKQSDSTAAADEEKTKSEDDKSADAAKSDSQKKDDEKSGDKDDKAAAKSDKAKDEKKKPETHKVKSKKLSIEMEVDGVFVASDMTEVPLRPEKWSKFEVVEAKPHGVKVRKGDMLVRFDDEDLEEAIAEASLEQRLGELTMMETEEEFPRLEKAVELNFTEAKRSYDETVDEFKRFKETMRPLSEKMASYNLKSAEQYLQNAEEELKQLKAMYEADELTEETEEIVLKRQEFEVDYAKFYVEYSKINHDYTMSVAIPRRQEALELGLEQATLAFEQAKTLKSVSLPRERYHLEQLREQRTKSVEDHAKLLADRDLMTLRAPVDGILYYGKCVDGRWAEIGGYKSKLQPHSSVTPNAVVFTIVDPDSMFMLTSIGEKEFPTIAAGQSGTASPIADDQVELPVKVRSIESAPGAGNKFAVELDVDTDKAPDWLFPGMSCKAKFTTYEAKDAVVIPANLVQSDEDDAKKKYVWIVEDADDEDAKPVRRDIKLGKSKDKEVEVVKGLKAGELIAKEPPKKDDDDKA